MKHLRKFNESFDVPTGKKIKEEILEIVFLLNDIDLEVYVGCGANAVVITIERRKNDSDDQTIHSKGFREWDASLPQNESYLEFIDRVEEIVHKVGYDVYKNDLFSRIMVLDKTSSMITIRKALSELTPKKKWYQKIFK